MQKADDIETRDQGKKEMLAGHEEMGNNPLSGPKGSEEFAKNDPEISKFKSENEFVKNEIESINNRLDYRSFRDRIIAACAESSTPGDWQRLMDYLKDPRNHPVNDPKVTQAANTYVKEEPTSTRESRDKRAKEMEEAAKGPDGPGSTYPPQKK